MIFFTPPRSYRAWMGLGASGWLEFWWERDPTGNTLWKKDKTGRSIKQQFVFFPTVK